MERKPSRLRAACNACHAAKLRCSGEKTGCKRCRANGLTCEYQVSMVGRASSKNTANKKRRVDPPSSSSPPPAIAEDGATTTMTTRAQSHRSPDGVVSPPALSVDNDTQLLQPTPTDSGLTSAPTPRPDAPLDPGYQLPRDDCECDHLVAKFHPPDGHGHGGIEAWPDVVSMDLPLDFDFAMPDIEGTIADLQQLADLPTKEPLEHSPAAHGDRCAIAALEPPAERPHCADPQHGQYRHVLHMVKVVGSLEAKCAQAAVDLDDILRFNKACMRTINQIFEAEGKQFCRTCKVLAPTALDLVLNLYERAIAQAREPATQKTLQLGCFELEAADQSLLQNVVVSRELRRTAQMMQTLSQSSRCPGMGAACGMVHWYAGMEARIEGLMPAPEEM